MHFLTIDSAVPFFKTKLFICFAIASAFVSRYFFAFNPFQFLESLFNAAYCSQKDVLKYVNHPTLLSLLKRNMLNENYVEGVDNRIIRV